MLSTLHGGFFFFFAACITIMGTIVYFLVPETKGRSLESMDEIFGSAYVDLVEVELRDYRRDVKGEKDLEKGKREEKVRRVEL
jgi:hypothetical protein